MYSMIGFGFALILVTIWAVPLVIFRGWVLSVLWGWFAVPIFQLPAISVAQSIAVALTVSFLTHQQNWTAATDHKKTRQAFTHPFLVPIVALCMGWIVKGYL